MKREEIVPTQLCKHFKGGIYRIIAVGKSTDNLEELVVYEDVDAPHLVWVRTLEEFTSPVDKDKYPDCEQEDRFVAIGPFVKRRLDRVIVKH